MMIDQIKKSYLILLLTLICFSFSSYILLSPFKASQEITKDFEGDKTETAKETVKELVDLNIEQSLTLSFIFIPAKKNIIEKRDKLPFFVKPPNTPPPNLS